METKQKTLLEECRDKIAVKYKFDNWENFSEHCWENRHKNTFGNAIDEAAELYAGQTNKEEIHKTSFKLDADEIDAISYPVEPVSLDAVKSIVNIMYENKSDENHEGSWIDSRHFYKVAELIAKWQSQQPAYIAFLSDEELREIANEFELFEGWPIQGLNMLQNELRKRVIDPVGFAEWISGCMYDRIIVKEGEDYVYRGWTDGHETVAESTEELLQIYINNKTK